LVLVTVAAETAIFKIRSGIKGPPFPFLYIDNMK